MLIYFDTANLVTILLYLSVLVIIDGLIRISALQIHTKWKGLNALWQIFGVVVPLFWIVRQTFRPMIETTELVIVLGVAVFYALFRERIWLQSKEGKIVLLTNNGP